MSRMGGEASFREICRENGWRFTRQRLAVWSFVRANRTHPGVEDVLAGVRKEAPSLTRESAFRILCEFVSAGLISRLDHLPIARFDSSTRMHGHFICLKCGRIVDFELPSGFDVHVPVGGAVVQTMEVRASGVCAHCAITLRR